MLPARFSSHALIWGSALALFIIILLALPSGAQAAGRGQTGLAAALPPQHPAQEARAFLPLPENPDPAQLATATSTPEPRRPTRTPGPTSTPVPIPPPQDPGVTQMMVAFGILVVVVILFGVWLNRKNAV